MHADEGTSKVRAVIEKNLENHVWLEGRVLRLREKSDAVIDSVDDSSVYIRRKRDSSMMKIVFDDLFGVALSSEMPGAELGEPVPSTAETYCDMLLVTDRPLLSTWEQITNEGPYFWRSSKAYNLFNRMSVLGTHASIEDDHQKKRELAKQLIECGQSVLEMEPEPQEASFYWCLGTSWRILEHIENCVVAHDLALELHAKRGGLEDAAERVAKWELGVGLAVLGAKNDDMDAYAKAYALLSTLDLNTNDPAYQIRNMLRDSLKK